MFKRRQLSIFWYVVLVLCGWILEVNSKQFYYGPACFALSYLQAWWPGSRWELSQPLQSQLRESGGPHMLERKQEWHETLSTGEKGDLKVQWNGSAGREASGLTFSAAGCGALEGARDRLPGFLLCRSRFQRHGADQLTDGRRLRSKKKIRFNTFVRRKTNKSDSERKGWGKKRRPQKCVRQSERVLLISAYLLGSKKMLLFFYIQLKL